MILRNSYGNVYIVETDNDKINRLFAAGWREAKAEVKQEKKPRSTRKIKGGENEQERA